LVTRIEIENFRSIKSLATDAGALTAFIGTNGSGKSNVLRALNLFFNGQLEPGVDVDISRDFHKPWRRIGNRAIDVSLTFSLPDVFRFNQPLVDPLSGIGITPGAAFEMRRRWQLDKLREGATTDSFFVRSPGAEWGAALAARKLLANERLSLPRGGGRREDLRLLERRGAMQARNAALNQLSALLVTAPDQPGGRLGALSVERLAQAAARLRQRADVVTGVLRRLGLRAVRLSAEVADAEPALAALVAEVAPELLKECGVGPACGAQLVVSSGDPSRMRSEASFAALAGTSPVDASSGKQRRHWLNRGGDRQLNWALHVIALQRIRHRPETSAYHQRLLAAGKSTREARRCIKRALSRHFYHRLREIPTLPLTT
jgi:energy-coupling factor transporter ATP-binding protein EcfA2